MTRLSRKERQAHTRECLMEAATRVFARKGLHSASVDEVAADAGYTKGAFYSNFASKQELFLAMLDQRFGDRLADIEAAMSTDAPVGEQAAQAGRDFMAAIGSDDEWERLFFEFTVHAARDEDFREELVTRYRTLRARIAELYASRCEEAGKEPPIPPDHFATMMFAMGNGIALERLLEPEAVPDELYPQMLRTFFAGLGQAAESGAAGGPPDPVSPDAG